MYKKIPNTKKSYLVTLFFYGSFLLLSLINQNLNAQNIKNIPFEDLSKERINFIPFLEVYSTTADLQVSKVNQLIQTKQLFKASTKASQGFSDKFYWLHFDINWSEYSKSLVLELDNAHIDNVILWQKVNDTFIKIGFGGDKNNVFKNRSYLNRRYIFPLENTQENTEYFLMIDKRNSSVSFPLWLWNKKEFETAESSKNISYGIFFGIIFFLGILALITGILVRKRVFFYYSGYTLSMSVYLFTALGFSYRYLYPNAENFNNYSRVILSVLLAIFLTLFLKSYLKMDKNNPFLSKIYKCISGVILLLSFFWILFPDVYNVYAVILLNFSNILFVSIILIAFYVAYKNLKKDKFNAVVFLIAFSAMMIGVILFLSIENGFINESIFPLNPILLGSGIEIMVFSTAMLYQLSKFIISRENLKQEFSLLTATKQSLEQQKIEFEKETNEFKNQLNDSEIITFTEPKTVILKSKAVLQFNDIIYICSDGHYLEFYLSSKDAPEVDRNSIKAILNQLPKNTFVQIHRSYIVNINYLKVIKASEVLLKNGVSLPISRSFKIQVKDFVSSSE